MFLCRVAYSGEKTAHPISFMENSHLIFGVTFSEPDEENDNCTITSGHY